jgi:hypothetical protein
MPRSKSRNTVLQVKPTISEQQLNYLEQLVDIGNYGNTPTTVAGTLIQRGIDDMMGRGLIQKVRVKSSKRPAKRSVRGGRQRNE